MSDVQLSCGPERPAARRTFPLQRRTSVCRNLFGPVDHDELQRDMKSKLREISERDQERWNFNFQDNSPLDGLYEWEPVSGAEAPAFYRDSVQSGRTRVPATPVKRSPAEPVLPETPQRDVMERLSAPEAPSSPCTTCATCATNQENRKDKMNSGRPHRAGPGVKRRRPDTSDSSTRITDTSTRITDFFVKRKRLADRSPCHLSTKSPVSVCPVPVCPVPVEQTPKKRIR